MEKTRLIYIDVTVYFFDYKNSHLGCLLIYVWTVFSGFFSEISGLICVDFSEGLCRVEVLLNQLHIQQQQMGRDEVDNMPGLNQEC